jgi:hypothetical protein
MLSWMSSLFGNPMSLDEAIRKAWDKGNIKCYVNSADFRRYGVQDTVISFRDRISACSVAMQGMLQVDFYALQHSGGRLLLPNLKIALEAVGYKLTPAEQELGLAGFNAKVLISSMCIFPELRALSPEPIDGAVVSAAAAA